MAGRKSSVEHLTASKMEAIVNFMKEHNCGFIIRWRGIEVGIDLETIGQRSFVEHLRKDKDYRNRVYIRKGGI